MNYCVYGASGDRIPADYLAGGRELGRCLARHGHGMVFGGGNHGMMGAAAQGVAEIRAGMTGDGGRPLEKEEGPAIIGISPEFFHEGDILYPGCTKMILTENMRERKQKMEELSDGFIITPGGLGTLDEFFEIATLRQLGRHGKPVTILNLKGYFDPMRTMLEKAVEEHFMSSGSMELLHFFGEPEELVCWIEQQGVNFVDWHTMKYK